MLARDHVAAMMNGGAKPACRMRAETLLSVRTGLQAQVRRQSPVLCRGAQWRKAFCSRTPRQACIFAGSRLAERDPVVTDVSSEQDEVSGMRVRGF